MTERSGSLEKLRKITTTLQRISECPVCLEALKFPFKTCTSGHSICESCVNNLKNCPTCQAQIQLEMPNVPIVFRNLLEALPRNCKFSDKSCDEIIEPGDEHEAFCGLRPFKCFQKDCDVEVPLLHLIKHYEEDHPHPYNFVLRKMSEVVTWCKFNPKNGQKSLTPFFVEDNWFWIIETNDVEEKCLKLRFEATPIGKLQSDYYVTVKFKKDNFVFTHTLKAEVKISKSLTDEENNDMEASSDHENHSENDENHYKMK